MQECVIFSIIKKFDFCINFKTLYDLYHPIIGSASYNLYIQLFNESEKLIQMGIKNNNLDSLLKLLKMSNSEFNAARYNLEAIGLLNTFVDEKENKLFFQLMEPLCFNDFVAKQKHRHLLFKIIGEENYQRLEYLYNNEHIPQSYVRITKTFDQIWNDNDIKNTYSFNFDNLYHNIIKKSHQSVIISTHVKQLIEFYFETYSLTLNEIEHCIYNSIIEMSNNEFAVDYDLLQANLKKYINSFNNINIYKQIKLNRNLQIFKTKVDHNSLLKIFDLYKNINSEQFYSLIKKTSLSTEEIETISVLRNTYLLNDELINLMIDFSLLKSNGHFNKKYLLKMGQTANAMNLLELTSMYDYLMNRPIDQQMLSAYIPKESTDDSLNKPASEKELNYWLKNS